MRFFSLSIFWFSIAEMNMAIRLIYILYPLETIFYKRRTSSIRVSSVKIMNSMKKFTMNLQHLLSTENQMTNITYPWCSIIMFIYNTFYIVHILYERQYSQHNSDDSRFIYTIHMTHTDADWQMIHII